MCKVFCLRIGFFGAAGCIGFRILQSWFMVFIFYMQIAAACSFMYCVSSCEEVLKRTKSYDWTDDNRFTAKAYHRGNVFSVRSCERPVRGLVGI